MQLFSLLLQYRHFEPGGAGKRWCVMLDDVEFDPAKLDADILFDAPDDELERAATVAGGQAVTVGVQCTFWYHCGWPL